MVLSHPAEPEQYDPKFKKWRMADLPIVPDRFDLVVRDERSKKQMAVVTKLLGVFVVPGWTSVMVLVGIVGGVQLIVMGIVGEYVGRIADEVKRRPLYVVRETHGIELRERARN